MLGSRKSEEPQERASAFCIYLLGFPGAFQDCFYHGRISSTLYVVAYFFDLNSVIQARSKVNALSTTDTDAFSHSPSRERELLSDCSGIC